MGLASNKNDNERQKIFAAALELFSAKGYEDTTIQQIANKAETTEKKVHIHFESKADLFIELMATEFKLDQDPIEVIFQEIDVNKAASEIVYRYIYNRLKHFRFFGKKIMREIFSVSLHLIKSKPNMMKKFIDLDFLFVDDLITFLNELKAKGVLPEGYDSNQAAETVYSTLAFEFLLYVYEEEHTEEQLLQGIKNKVHFIFT
ncbi:TetR/AcrR family transcriptional regulator [Pontibacillus yanchengensis]|uniref:HTH tetR-type domain-containing protein n=1 Tax=Pontibacillus yanchengensis Y32 TaxID=1385514 RepID=A0A0A2T761_9BACI|nr:TetR/AcrR family transcriptional regulator [Pontibacillus yanchengensis]KGP71652.1 hypothetical protein N782_17775 [Pontibacillus yanchengensis Y32]